MDSRKQRKIFLINMIIASFIISFAFFVFEATSVSYKDTGKGIDLWQEVYTNVLTNYVDELDAWKVAKFGADGIIQKLDPYSSFFDEPSDYKQLQEESKGEFAGLGIMISTRNDYPTIMEPPFQGEPADKVGLRAGDVIIEIEGESTYKMPINEVVSKLRGEINTIVNIKVRRGIGKEPLKFTIKRDRIKIVNISYSGEIVDNIGYIKLNRFNAEAPGEMSEALMNLTDNDNIKGVILDLRYNPGGLLTVARDIANEFLPKNSDIVLTRGRNSSEYKKMVASDMPSLPTMPLVVLVNGGSASASEIVAGAIQDHDRGVLVGETTFGKGSVQTLYNLTGGTGLKLTTAHYYTPSGRCIHRKENGESKSVAFSREEEELRGSNASEEDSLETGAEFWTLKKERIVREGGGITPDIVVKEKTVGNIVRQLVSQSIFFDFAQVYAEKNPGLTEDFTITESLVREFKEYISNDSIFDYSIPGKTYLDDFRSAIDQEKYDNDILDMIDNIAQTLKDRRDEDFDTNIEVIKRILKREIAAIKFGYAARTIASKDWDVQLQKAIEILSNPDKYESILAKGAKTGIEEEVVLK